MNTNNIQNRRAFLKKAVYAAPVVLAMGSLSAQANTAQATSRIYVNPETKTTVQSGGANTIIVTTPTGGTVTVNTSTGSPLSGFGSFINRPR